MILPIQTTFRNIDSSKAATELVEEQAARLEKFFDRIASCRVMIESSHGGHRPDSAVHVRIELGVPGRELVVTHQSSVSGKREIQRGGREDAGKARHDVYGAIHEAFDAVRRQLQDYVHCLQEK